MHLPKIRILNFDGSLLLQRKLLAEYQPENIDLHEMGPECRLWASRAHRLRLSKILSSTDRHSITLYGSGDFHHISAILLEQFKEPITVIVFDHHPDWDILPPYWHCGSWVSRVVTMPNVKKVILFGVSSCDISTHHIQTGNLAALSDDRLEIYPYVHEPTRFFLRRAPQRSRSVLVEKTGIGGKLSWRELKGANLESLFAELLTRIEVEQVYVSIDKDCLKPEDATTNWDGGYLRLSEVLTLLTLIKKHLDLVGADICGEYSEPVFKGLTRKLFNWIDRPGDFSAMNFSIDEIITRNEATNLKILELLQND